MHIRQDVDLKFYNTFGLPAKAGYFVEIRSVSGLIDLLAEEEWRDYPKFILGGGSNVLLLDDVHALTIRMAIDGIEVVKEDDESVWLKVGAGVVWHEFVKYAVACDWGGVENLSLIPGTVGAAPIQNIGAYGVELKDVFVSLEAIEIKTGNVREFGYEACRFGYRESVFKLEQKGNYIICSVTMRLSKKPVLRLDYGDIRRVLKEGNVESPTIRDVSDAVIAIRKSKLPDPAVIGNAGSFFKNPEVTAEVFETLRMSYPDIPGFVLESGRVKVPAGWLIEKLGWKGFREGDIGVHARQALVLVNYGNGKGEEIKRLSERIRASVTATFNIDLQPEVNFIRIS